jgi:hypothetical protein
MMVPPPRGVGLALLEPPLELARTDAPEASPAVKRPAIVLPTGQAMVIKHPC